MPPVPELVHLGKPLVITLHGVAPLAIPFLYTKTSKSFVKLFWSNIYKKVMWRYYRDRISQIVAVSAFGKRSILAHLSVKESIITVIPNAVDADLFSSVGVEVPETKDLGKYYLHISNGEARKNVNRILKAHASLAGPDTWPLVLKAPKSLADHHGSVINISRRLSDAEIVTLYRNAGAFVFPSFYEGFGLPILEAMASGCPVITAQGSACSEVAGDAALLVNPHDVSDIREKMATVAGDPAVRTELQRLGQQRVMQYSWSETANLYAQTFERAMAQMPHP